MLSTLFVFTVRWFQSLRSATGSLCLVERVCLTTLLLDTPLCCCHVNYTQRDWCIRDARALARCVTWLAGAGGIGCQDRPCCAEEGSHTLTIAGVDAQ